MTPSDLTVMLESLVLILAITVLGFWYGYDVGRRCALSALRKRMKSGMSAEAALRYEEMVVGGKKDE